MLARLPWLEKVKVLQRERHERLRIPDALARSMRESSLGACRGTWEELLSKARAVDAEVLGSKLAMATLRSRRYQELARREKSHEKPHEIVSGALLPAG